MTDVQLKIENEIPVSQGDSARGSADRSVGKFSLAIWFAWLLALSLSYKDLFFYRLAMRVRLPEEEDLFFSSLGSRPDIVLSIAGVLLLSRSRYFLAGVGNPGSLLVSIPLLMCGILLAAWSRYAGVIDLLAPSLTLTLLGSGLFLAGRTGLALITFPALFVLFAIPIPPVLVNALIYPLQLMTAATANAVVNLLGWPSEVYGIVIQRGSYGFEVIESCAGFRIMQILLMTGVIYAQVFRRNWRRTLFLGVVGVALGFCLNGIRVVMAVLSPDPESFALHTLQGVAMTLVGVLSIASIDSLIERARRTSWLRPERISTTLPISPSERPLTRWVGVFLVALLLMGIQSWVKPTHPTPDDPYFRFGNTPFRIGAWQGSLRKLDSDFLGSVAFSEYTTRSYRANEEEEILVLLGTDDRRNRSWSLLSEKTRVPGSQWSLESIEEGPKPGQDRAGRTYIYRKDADRRLVYHERIGTGSFWEELFYQWTGLDRTPFGRSYPARIIQISTRIPASPEGRETAARTIQSFLERLLPRVQLKH